MAHMNLVLYCYAAIVLIGGVAGYASAKSPASLASSIPAALLAALAGFMVAPHKTIGLAIGLVVSGTLGIFFLYRLAKTRKAMPASPMIVLSACVMLLCAYGIISRLSAHAAG